MDKNRKIDLSNMTRHDLEEEFVKVNDRVMALQAEVNWLREQLKLSRSKKYGASSEKGLADGEQLSLFNEAELHQDPQAEEPTEKDLTAMRKKASRKGGKQKKTRSLPIERTEYRLSEEEQVCPRCGEALHVLKKEVHDEIEVIPAQYKVKRTVRYVYACRNCEKNGTEATIIRADAPAPLFRNSLASPSLVADIISRKYVLALPLYRQEQELKRSGLDITRQTMSNWIILAADQYLYRLYEAMKKQLLQEDILHADETTVQVLQEEGRAASSKSYMWLYASGRESSFPCCVYEYRPGRSASYPKVFLENFTGYLQTDGYQAYGTVAADPDRDPGRPILSAGCFAHARRKFTDALKASSGKEPPNIMQGIRYCDRLFAIERECADSDPEQRKSYRKEHAEPVLREYFAWLKSIQPEVLPKSKLGEAVTYSLNQEESLCRYLEDGRLEISNNRAERLIKPFVIGRKNWLFSNTPDGAASSAMIYSIVETAKLNKIKPFEYIQHVLTVLSQTPETAIETLLPWSNSLPAECRQSEPESDAD